MKKVIEALVLCLSLQAAASALEITAVSTASANGVLSGDFTFSALTVKGVTYEKGAVIMPVTENKGKTYSDVKLLSKTLYGKLEACFKAGCAKHAKSQAAPRVKIAALKPLKSKVRVANAELSFDEELLVVAGVMVSAKEPGTYWVAFPGTLAFPDAAFKSAVESAVIAAWAKKNK
jgi:hypothetical protein